MKNSLNTVIIIMLLCLMITFSVNASINHSPLSKGHGEITVRNDSNKDLYISISGRNQGSVGANQSESFDVRYGNHRVEAEWDGGSIHKYVSIFKSSPHADWYISQDDVE